MENHWNYSFMSLYLLRYLWLIDPTGATSIRRKTNWTGGRCNWGGSHNLREDCQVLANFFTKISGLKEVKKKLTQFENQEEFETKKQDLSRQCQEAINGLQVSTGAATSVGGVCCIWGSYTEHLDGLISTFRRELESLSGDIGRTPYNVAKKLKKLQLEEKNLKRAIEENLKRAAMEKDPEKKKKILILVEEDKKKFQANLAEQAKIRIGENFDPDTYIEDFLKGVEDKLAGRERRGGRGSGNWKKPRDPSNPYPDNADGNNDESDNGDNRISGRNPWRQPQQSHDSFQQNQQLFIIAGVVVLVVFLLMSRKDGDEIQRRRNYDYDY